MATVTKTIGTASRDYSTITLWEADLDNFSTIYANGDDAVGECYNDSDFNEVVNINGGGTSITGLNSIKLTVAEADRHDGTAGTGARMVYDSKIQMYSDKNIEVCWLEIDWGGTSAGGNQFSIVYTHNNSYQQKIANMLVHDAQSASTARMIQGKYGYLTVANNIIYNLTHTSTYRGYGIYVDSYRPSYAYNNTVHNIQSTHPSAAYTFGIHFLHSNNIRNNIVTEVGDGIYSGCFGNSAGGTNSNNMSTDDTAPGPNSLTEVTASAQFVSVVEGAEDLHLATGSEAIGAGANLGSAGDIVQFDIDGVYRGSVWDIGADQTPATVTKTIGTSSRDYSTMAAWAADLGTQGVYANSDIAIGECYNDSIFTNPVLINHAGVGVLESVTLKAAEGERHDGTTGTGVLNTTTGQYQQRFVLGYSNIPILVEGIEIRKEHWSGQYLVMLANYSSNISLSKMLLRGTPGADTSAYAIGISFWEASVDNCIIYNINNGFNVIDFSAATNRAAVNNTCYTLQSPFLLDYRRTDNKFNVKNNVFITADPSNFDSVAYLGTINTDDFATWDNNMGNAGTIYGNSPFNGVSSSEMFVSTVSGSEDLHSAPASPAIDNGIDLSSYTALEYFGAGFASEDIDGQLRTGIWDIGADELLGGHIRRLLLGIG